MQSTKKTGDHTFENYITNVFSADNICSDIERKILEKKYNNFLDITDKFNRKSVSYQLNKEESIHSWLKYKEGFSSDLVNIFLNDMNIQHGDMIMDPFMGSGTTALVCKMRGIDCIGYDVLPLSEISIKAKSDINRYNLEELSLIISEIKKISVPNGYQNKTPYITITKNAYPEENEKLIQYITEWKDDSDYSEQSKNLLTLCIINSLEKCSYTSKDGQYLGWDSRSKKIIESNKLRKTQGKPLIKEKHVRKEIQNFKDTVVSELTAVLEDIKKIRALKQDLSNSRIEFKTSSVLYELPKLEDNILNGVITSPPYCNRYDYTRTYALELVYLGIGEDKIKDLRQSLLSCTVESKNKIESLKEYYKNIGKSEWFSNIYSVIKNNKALNEVINALNIRKERRDLNNNGIIRMVEGYFTELTFLYAELYRLCKKGSFVVFVNDNVRYGGEVIPVDFISCSLAEELGFKINKIYTLKQRKGNSSQQMAKFGRVPLRKSITVWSK